MSQTVLPMARSFDGWARLPVSEKRRASLLTNIEIERALWSTLEYYSEVEEVGLNLIQTKGLQPQSLHQEIFQYLQAFVRQAKSYYGSAKTLHYRSSSLLYYYSFLNLVKAYLLLKNPQMIMGRTNQAVTHGLSYKTSTTNTDFQLEIVRVCDGIFPIFYEAETSTVISTAINSTLNISSLLGYPTDINREYLMVNYGNGKILSSLAAILTHRPQNQAWTVLGIPARPGLNEFLNLHSNFLNAYQEVQIYPLFYPVFDIPPQELLSHRFFQDITPIPMNSIDMVNENVLFQKIIDALNPHFSVHYYDDHNGFDLALPYQDATHTTPLPMNEVLAIYAVMFYLSSLVRYRPNYLESLLNHKPAWLIENFVNSTPETFLKMMVSKIVGTDFVFRRR